MDLFVVITTIHNPTPAIHRFEERVGDRLIVVGDAKTPASWRYGQAECIPIDAQRTAGWRLTASVPVNHYARKIFGYLRAIERGAEVIYDADDDNLPKADWRIPDFDGVYPSTADGAGFVNAYASFTDMAIWPRGFPLDLIRGTRKAAVESPRAVRVGVWQALADGDPDVDAIFRLTIGASCVFDRRDPLVLGVGSPCPFNSQATAVRRELFPLLYLPSTVTFRFCDILRGLVAQPIMWNAGYQLGFTEATVVQDRHPHDLLDDFESELPCYLLPRRVTEVVSASIVRDLGIAENLVRAYDGLTEHGLVAPAEGERVRCWLDDLAVASSS